MRLQWRLAHLGPGYVDCERRGHSQGNSHANRDSQYRSDHDPAGPWPPAWGAIRDGRFKDVEPGSHGLGDARTMIVGQSPALRRVLDDADRVAATDSTALLLGETGTGKELFATRIHERSARRGRGMVRVNCSAIPATLMESELFGREKGAFTGALARQIGRFELADHSTIFLDEIGELPPDVQVKLLRVLEERQFERLGSPKADPGRRRAIIAATHRDLERRIADGTFREDLFYRLNVFPIQVPPLRERVEDIPLLVWRFVEEFSKAFGKRIDVDPAREHGRAAALLLAGQHPRAAQRRRARDDRRDRTAS